MPFILPFVPLIAAGVGAAGLGLTVDELVNQPGQQQQPTSTGPTQAQLAQQQQLQQKEAFLANQGNTQAQTGGSLTPQGSVAQTGANIGQPLDMQAILKLLAGQGGGGSVSGGSSGTNTNTTLNQGLV